MALLVLATGWVPAESFTTNVVSGAYTNAGTLYVVGDTGPSNALEIVNGGWLESERGLVGNTIEASRNAVRVSGSGSRWQAVSRFDLGRQGSFNQVTLEAGAFVETGATTIGLEAVSSGNELRLAGAGTQWRSPGGFLLGQAGSGQRLRLSTGARLTTGGICAVGYSAPSHGNEVLITDPGTAWFQGIGFGLGDFGSDSNLLVIAAGGLLNCVEGTIGNGTGNRAWVSGPGSTWDCRGTLFVGGEGLGNQVVVTNGGRLNSVSAYVSGATNEVVVSGGALWQTGGAGTQLVLGYQGAGNRLWITNASTVTAHDAHVLGDDNALGLGGAQSLLDVRGEFIVGAEFARRNRVVLGDGAALRAGVLRMAGDRAEVRAAGGATRLWVTNEVWVGDAFGAGNQLRLEAGARLTSGPGYVGGEDSPFNPHDRGQTNAVLLQGAGTLWSVDGQLRIGSTGGRSLLHLADAAQLENDDGYVGYHGSSRNNEVVLSGAATLWNNRGVLHVGYEGWGNRLLATNGVTLLSAQAALGWKNGRDNTVEVAGFSTRWINQGDLTVGGAGHNNALMLRDGAFLETAATQVGAHPGSTTEGKSNRVWISGSGTVLTNRTTLAVGQFNGFNTLVVSNQARVDAAAWILGNPGPFFNNACRIVEGGRVRLHDTPSVGPARWTVTRASVLIEQGEVDAASLLVTGGASDPFEFRGGLLRIRTAASVSNQTVFRVGNGSAPARLEVGPGPHLFADGLELAASASARLEGMMTGSLTNHGSLEVGQTTAALRVLGAMHLASPGELTFELAGATPGVQADWIDVEGPVRLGGTLRIRLLEGFIPYSVEVLPLIDHLGVSGSFLNVPHGGRVFVEGTSNSFRLDVTATRVVLTDFSGPDALPDSDGIEDAWALLYFGHTPLTQEEKDSDADLDGESAYREYVAGTSPLEAASVFRIQSRFLDESGRMVLRFPAATNRVYGVDSTHDLVMWERIQDPVLVPVAGGHIEWVDPAPAPGRRFYRVGVALPPAD